MMATIQIRKHLSKTEEEGSHANSVFRAKSYDVASRINERTSGIPWTGRDVSRRTSLDDLVLREKETSPLPEGWSIGDPHLLIKRISPYPIGISPPFVKPHVSGAVKEEEAERPPHQYTSLEEEEEDVVSSDDGASCDKNGQEEIIEGCSVTAATFNCLNVMMGPSLISAPFSLAKTGWAGLGMMLFISILAIVGAQKLAESNTEGATSYIDIVQAKLGVRARVIVAILLYLELVLACSATCIMAGQALTVLAPVEWAITTEMWIDIFGFAILPTMFINNIVVLSYLSVISIASFCILLGAISLQFAFTETYLTSQTTLFSASQFPISCGLMAFPYGGTVIFPSVRATMAEPERFNFVMITACVLTFFAAAAVGSMGYVMCGSDVPDEATPLSTVILLTMIQAARA